MPIAQVLALSSFVVMTLVVLWLIFRCKHDWEPVVERELPSKAEILKANGENIASWRQTEDLKDISSKTFFALISCKKCGAVKDYTVRT